MSYNVTIDRDGGIFAIEVDYYVEPYYDPETGEVFSDTSWTASYGGGGTGGWGSEFGWAYVELGFGPAASSFANYIFDFHAENTFSGASTSFSVNVLEAAYATVGLATAGTAGEDIVISGSGDDVLGGGDGNDILDAGAGDDVLAGGAGADHLDGGIGNDTMAGGAGDDFYVVDSAGDAVVEQADGGTDTVTSFVDYVMTANVERLYLGSIAANLDGTGNDGANNIYGNGSANHLSGLGGNDELHGDRGADHLQGGAGDDLLDGGVGKDVMEGGDGNDSYVVDSSVDQVIEAPGGGIDTVRSSTASYTLGDGVEDLLLLSFRTASGTGNALANTISGAHGSNTLDGAAGADILYGLDGNDVLIGGAGADQLAGGNGLDWASYETSAQRVSVDLAAGAGLVGDAKGDVLTGIENVRGGAGDDLLKGDAGANTLEGGAGDDTLVGNGGDDTLVGGLGADRLLGGTGADTASYRGSAGAVIVDLALQTAVGGDADGDTLTGIENAAGGAGDDSLTGNGGANTLFGDAGSDTLQGGAGDDTIEGGAGGDNLMGGLGFDMLSYAHADDAVTVDLAAGTVSGSDAVGDIFADFEGAIGGAHNDTLTGNGFANRLQGGAGDDVITGGAGDDTILSGVGKDTMAGGDGVDTLSYSDARTWVSVFLTDGYTITGTFFENDSFSGFENVTGGAFSDGLYGNSGDNTLRGGGGGDFLFGGGGTDRLIGGEGDDTFATYVAAGRVTVVDFQAGGTEDRLYFDLGESFDTFAEVMAVATTTAAGNTIFQFAPDQSLVLLGVDKASLTTADLVFATS